MNEKQTFSDWVKEHKRGIVVGVGITATVFCGILIWKNCDEVYALTAKVSKAYIKKPVSLQSNESVMSDSLQPLICEQQKITSSVSSFVRNLPDGQHASPSKIATATEHGFELVDNQTWVEPFTRTIAA